MVHLNTEDNLDELTEETKKNLGDQWWRLNNLYYIIDTKGRKVKFKPNWAQKLLFYGMWYLNNILKARQLGISTFILLYMLDTCLFNPNIRAGVIAHNKDDAKILYRDKIKFAYDNLPEWVKRLVTADTRSAQEIVFNNNSSVRVGTSMRSGTLQILHISEFGKICAKYPEKAREIVTGAFETVHPGQTIFIESTAEGREGTFFDMCQEAKKLHDARKRLSQLDYKFWFFPWWKHPENVLDPANIVILPPLQRYFEEVEGKIGIKFTTNQKAWYFKKWNVLGEDVKREHPSTPEEAFEQSTEGAYYKQAFVKVRKENRIAKVPHRQGISVDTWWDIGLNDTTAIWFTQTVGTRIHVIDYFENSGEGMPYYKGILDEKHDDMDYQYGRHVWPHDGGNGEWGGGAKTRQQMALEIGLRVEIQERTTDKVAGINSVRDFLSICWFDEEKCEQSIGLDDRQHLVGLNSLEMYRKEWDKRLGCWKRTPLHDWASNGADAFRTLSDAYQSIIDKSQRSVARSRKTKPAGGWT